MPTEAAQGSKCKGKGKGKGKGKTTLGTSDKEGGSRTTQNPMSVTFIGEDITAEEACLIDAAIASSLATSRVKSMLWTQSAGAGPSNLGERFEGTWEPQQAMPFTGFSPTMNLESQVLYTGFVWVPCWLEAHSPL